MGVPSYDLGEDGILRITFPPGDTFDAASALMAVAEHRSVAAGRKLPTLVDVSNLRSMDREARELVSGPAVASVTARLAIVVGGPVSAMIGNFFLRVTKPQYPTRLFESREAAERWLQRSDTE